ncbi:MAG: rhodanese-like domain-containing protein [Cyclobacteriaceae bacterium]
MKIIDLETLKKKLENDEVTLIEVLNKEEYEKSHIKGAINIPLKNIGAEAKERFETDDEIVVYCSDEECTASPTAAKKLEDLGFKNVYHFEGGKKEWKEAGHPME